jgi:hypothetical protein
MPSNPVRHAVARATGSTTLARKVGDEWQITCLNHGSETTAPVEGSRSKAWQLASHPQDWCAKCGLIAKGKADKITGDRLDIPKAPAKKAPAKKPTKKAAPKATVKKGA